MSCKKCLFSLNSVPHQFGGSIQFGTGTPDSVLTVHYTSPTGITETFAASTDVDGLLIIQLSSSIMCKLEPSAMFDGCHSFEFYNDGTGQPFEVADENGNASACVILDVELECNETDTLIELIYIDPVECGCDGSCKCLSCNQ